MAQDRIEQQQQALKLKKAELQRLEELSVIQRLNAEEQAARDRLSAEIQSLEANAGKQIEMTPITNTSADSRHFTLGLGIDGNLSNIYKDIIADYREIYPDYPVENNKLFFASDDSANVFFRTQAEKNRPFLVFKIAEDDKPDPEHVKFSCGNGKLYTGSIAEIKAELLKDDQTDPKVIDGMKHLEKAEAKYPSKNSRPLLDKIVDTVEIVTDAAIIAANR